MQTITRIEIWLPTTLPAHRAAYRILGDWLEERYPQGGSLCRTVADSPVWHGWCREKDDSGSVLRTEWDAHVLYVLDFEEINDRSTLEALLGEFEYRAYIAYALCRGAFQFRIYVTATPISCLPPEKREPSAGWIEAAKEHRLAFGVSLFGGM